MIEKADGPKTLYYTVLSRSLRMKKSTKLSEYIPWGFGIVTGLVGVVIAHNIMHEYKTLVNGALRVILIYLLWHYLLSLKIKGVDDRISEFSVFDFPANILLFMRTFFSL